jgi:hypothetical protein
MKRSIWNSNFQSTYTKDRKDFFHTDLFRTAVPSADLNPFRRTKGSMEGIFYDNHRGID